MPKSSTARKFLSHKELYEEFEYRIWSRPPPPDVSTTLYFGGEIFSYLTGRKEIFEQLLYSAYCSAQLHIWRFSENSPEPIEYIWHGCRSPDPLTEFREFIRDQGRELNFVLEEARNWLESTPIEEAANRYQFERTFELRGIVKKVASADAEKSQNGEAGLWNLLAKLLLCGELKFVLVRSILDGPGPNDPPPDDPPDKTEATSGELISFPDFTWHRVSGWEKYGSEFAWEETGMLAAGGLNGPPELFVDQIMDGQFINVRSQLREAHIPTDFAPVLIAGIEQHWTVPAALKELLGSAVPKIRRKPRSSLPIGSPSAHLEQMEDLRQVLTWLVSAAIQLEMGGGPKTRFWLAAKFLMEEFYPQHDPPSRDAVLDLWQTIEHPPEWSERGKRFAWDEQAILNLARMSAKARPSKLPDV